MSCRRKTTARKRLDYIENFLLACLPLVGFLLFLLIPLFLSLYMSLLDVHTPIIAEGVFIGFSNFASLLWGENAYRFYQSFLNTFIFWLNVPLSMSLGLAISYVLNKDIKGHRFFRMIYFIPYVCSSVAITLMFRMMYNTQYGILNTVLSGLGIGNVAWVTSSKYFMTSVMLMQTWRNIGFCVILFSAAIANVDRNLYEAAYLDGADARKVFFKITLPAISPTTYYLLTVCTIGALQVMGESQIMATDHYDSLDYAYNTVVLFIYDMAFSFPAKYGYGISAAASVLLVIFILLITRFSAVLSKRWVHYEF